MCNKIVNKKVKKTRTTSAHYDNFMGMGKTTSAYFHSLDNSDSCPTGVAHFLFPLF